MQSIGTQFVLSTNNAKQKKEERIFRFGRLLDAEKIAISLSDPAGIVLTLKDRWISLMMSMPLAWLHSPMDREFACESKSAGSIR